MSNKIEIDLDEARRAFRLLGKIQDLFHQPTKVSDPEIVAKFATDNYPEIKELYYNVVWE